MAIGCDRRLRVVDGSPRERIEDFSRVAAEGADEWTVRQVAHRLTAGAASPSARALILLHHVQSMPYWPDPPGRKDYVMQPCQTLVVGGDCEDLAVLLVALWVAAGLAGRLLWIVQRGDTDHVSAQVQLGGARVWGESTVRGARLGELPKQAAARLGVSRSRGSEL